MRGALLQGASLNWGALFLFALFREGTEYAKAIHREASPEEIGHSGFPSFDEK